MKQYIGISRDHSGSMSSITRYAMADYNDNIAAITDAASSNSIDTIVNVVKNGVGPGTGRVVREIVNSNITRLQPLTSYVANGTSTPLLDSVGELIDMMKAAPDAADPDVSFLVMVITDGHENSSRTWTAQRLAREIQELQATDKWTFVFRVPRNHTRYITALGVPEGNVLEWEQTRAGVETSSAATRQAFTNFYTERNTTGVKSTGRFFANLVQVPAAEVKAALREVSRDVMYFPVGNDTDIKTFIESRTGKTIVPGTVFYQLSKTEKVQDYKQIAVRDRTTHQTYSGHDARTLLGLPLHGEIKLAPGNNGNFDVFVQSTSLNRKLIAGTDALYWTNLPR